MKKMAIITVHEKATYLADAVFSASDGIVTTFAIVAGSEGASFNANVILILGFANLFADGFSMAAGNYLGVKSEIEFEEARGQDGNNEGSPFKHGLVSFFSFNISGLLPLVPFLFNFDDPFLISIVFVALAMFSAGSLRSFFTKKSFVKSGIEMLVIGGLAALVAYWVGFVLSNYVN